MGRSQEHSHMNQAYGPLAHHYGEWMSHLDYSAWWHYLRTTFAMQSGQSILELGCGTGCLTEHMAREGCQVVASDLSPEMLTLAEVKLRPYNNVNLILLDMRRLPTALGAFDYIIASCDAVNYLRTDEALFSFLQGARVLLKPGGTLLFDVHGPRRLHEFRTRPQYNRVGERSCYLWSVTVNDTLITHRLTGFIRGKDAWNRFDEIHHQRYFVPADITEAARRAGFGYIAAYDFLTVNPPHDKSMRVQFACQ